MEIDSITFENWGPYVGKQTVDLSVTGGAPVVVIHGENDRGKTSFLRGIFFALYGEVREKNRRFPIQELASQRVLERDGEVKFSVAIEFHHEGEKFVIERGGVARQDSSQVILSQDLWVEFRTDSGTLFPAAAVPDRINGILDQDIADFYLFDGEKLDDIIRKLTDRGGPSTDFVKNSVERAVGLSFVGQLREDLAYLRDEIFEKLQKDKRISASKEKLIGQIEQLQEKVRKNLADRDELIREKSAQVEAAENAQKQLDQFDEIRDLVVQRQTLSRQRVEKAELLEELLQERRKEVSARWLFPMEQVFNTKVEDIESRLAEAMRRDDERKDLEAEARVLAASVHSETCSYCGNDLSQKAREEAEARFTAIKAQLSEIPDSGDSLTQLSKQLSAWREFSRNNAGGTGLFSLFDRIDSYEQEILNLEHQEKKLSARIGDSETPDIVALEDQLKVAEQRITKADTYLDQLEKAKTQLSNELVGLKKKLSDSPEVSPEIREQAEVLEESLKITEDAFVDYRERMRYAVQEAASEALTRISSEPEFKVLSIGPEYQISILNGTGVPQKHSKGYEQVSAMAFIAGLAQTAGEKNLMAMDTPLGRLDKENRRGVLNWAAERPSQTILFVQSGELDESEARDLIKKKLGRQLKIKRVSQGSSEIVEVKP